MIRDGIFKNLFLVKLDKFELRNCTSRKICFFLNRDSRKTITENNEWKDKKIFCHYK